MKNNMNWNFDNSYSRLSNAFKEHIKPIAVKNPELVLINKDLVEEFDVRECTFLFYDNVKLKNKDNCNCENSTNV